MSPPFTSPPPSTLTSALHSHLRQCLLLSPPASAPASSPPSLPTTSSHSCLHLQVAVDDYLLHHPKSLKSLNDGALLFLSAPPPRRFNTNSNYARTLLQPSTLRHRQSITGMLTLTVSVSPTSCNSGSNASSRCNPSP